MKCVTPPPSIVEVSNEGLESLLNKPVCIFCTDGYIYTGILSGVNTDDIKLTNPRIVYDTGKWADPKWLDVVTLPTPALYIRTSQITSYFFTTKE